MAVAEKVFIKSDSQLMAIQVLEITSFLLLLFRLFVCLFGFLLLY